MKLPSDPTFRIQQPRFRTPFSLENDPTMEGALTDTGMPLLGAYTLACGADDEPQSKAQSL